MGFLRTVEDGLSEVGQQAQALVDQKRAKWVGPFRCGYLAYFGYAEKDDDRQFFFLEESGYNYSQDFAFTRYVVPRTKGSE